MKGEKKKLERPDLEVVTLEWIEKQRAKHDGLSAYEVSLQLGQPVNYLYQVKKGKMELSGPTKAAAWHYFQRMES